MRKLIVNEFLALDGVAQAPGAPNEDTREGFAHGGWHSPYGAENGVLPLIESCGGFILGRWTYELFAGFWPTAHEMAPAFAGPMNAKPKYVASTTLSGPLEWENSTLLDAPVSDSIRALKEQNGGDLLVIGSTVLVQSVLAEGLVDELRLMIDPVLVGGGKRLFSDDGALRPLRLVDHVVTEAGTIIATYAPA
ncbi:MAG TPA: dihydrofolate reductase family protein [Gaiellaceae bacterium]|jgi:dihydrofolate reductase